MEVRLLDDSLAEIKQKLKSVARVLENKYKQDPSKCKLYVIFKRGNIEMKEGEWLKNPSLANKLELNEAELDKIFSERNLNMGVLGYGSTKNGLKELLKWAKHNINPEKIKGEKRDLNIKIEELKTNKEHDAVKIVLRVPETGIDSREDLKNAKLEKLGYVGLKKWTKEQLDAIKDSENILDKVIYKILTGDAKLTDKVEEVTKKVEEVTEDEN